MGGSRFLSLAVFQGRLDWLGLEQPCPCPSFSLKLFFLFLPLWCLMKCSWQWYSAQNRDLRLCSLCVSFNSGYSIVLINYLLGFLCFNISVIIMKVRFGAWALLQVQNQEWKVHNCIHIPHLCEWNDNFLRSIISHRQVYIVSLFSL